MTAIQLPGSEDLLDPDEITKLEISTQRNGCVLIKLFFGDEGNPTLLDFPSKKDAIEFYRTIWQLRRSNEEQLVDLGDFG